MAICKPRQEASEETNPADTLILDFQPPELWEHTLLLFKLLSLLRLKLRNGWGLQLLESGRKTLTQPPGELGRARECKNSHEKGKGSFSRGHSYGSTWGREAEGSPGGHCPAQHNTTPEWLWVSWTM